MEKTLTVQQLEEVKTALVARLGTGDGDRTRIGAQLDLVDELIAGLNPEPVEREYLVLAKVTWKPISDSPQHEDAPMDFMHHLSLEDPRCTGYEFIAFGDEDVVQQYMGDLPTLRY